MTTHHNHPGTHYSPFCDWCLDEVHRGVRQPTASPGVSMTTIRPAGHRPVCAGCSTTLDEHCQTCGVCPGKPHVSGLCPNAN